jgi:hypothetical protein
VIRAHSVYAVEVKKLRVKYSKKVERVYKEYTVEAKRLRNKVPAKVKEITVLFK